jgi:maleylacetate reductase
LATNRGRWFARDELSQRVVFGTGRAGEAVAELDTVAPGRLLLVASPSATHVADDLTASRAVVARLHDVVQHVPEELVAGGLDRVASSDPDVIMTVGGGSAIGLGKALAVETGLPLVAVPTTYSGSEVTPVYGVTGTHKRTARDPHALPRLVVYDAELTLGLPRRVSATSGLNALAHAVEALYLPAPDPVTCLLAEEAVRVLGRSLPAVVAEPRGVEGREDALFGAYLAGSAFAHAGSALQHILSHVIGGTYGLGHADLHAVLLPYVAAYNGPAAPDAMRRVAAALDADDAADGLRALAERIDAPLDLKSLGLPEDALDDVAERTTAAVSPGNPRRVDKSSLRQLLEDAYAGKPPGTY